MPLKHRSSRWVERFRAMTVAILTMAAAGCLDVEGLSEGQNRLVVLPNDIVLESGVTQQFTGYTVTPAGDTVTANVAWSASGGTMTESGLFTAGDEEGEFSVLARTRAANSSSASSRFWVRHQLSALVISPDAATLQVRGEQRFSTFGRRGGDSVTVAVTFSAAGGEILADGLYRAGDVPGVYDVTATEQPDESVRRGNRPLRTATASIAVQDGLPLDRVVLLPPSAQLAPGETQQFASYGVTAAGDSIAVAVDYAATGGTVTPAGLYEAGSAAGDYLVIATESGGALADTSAVNVSDAPPTVEELILLPESATLYTGEAQQFTALGRLSSGDTVETEATFSASGGTVSADGRYVAGAAAGDYEVVATQVGGALADTAAVTVELVPVAEVVVTPVSATLEPGERVRLTAQARDSAGNDLSGRTPAWSSDAPLVATVNANGRVTAVDIGSATITATIEGISGTATVTVELAPVASVTVSPSSVSIQEGNYVQLTATLRDTAGNELTGRTVVWSSDQETVATVDATGLVYGEAQGSAVVTASSEGQSGSATVTVTAAPPPPPPPPSGIALTVQRLTSGSGTVLVSNGIPLPPGALQASNVGEVQVWVEGVEQAVYVEALEGRHSDGSVRSILVQFDYTLPDMTARSGQLALGTARSTTDLSKTTPPSVPSAVALPSSPDYLVTTLLAGELLTEANSTTTPDIQAQSDDYSPIGDIQWGNLGNAALRGGAQYEHPHTAYSQWLRSGDVTWWDRATRMARSYRQHGRLHAGGEQL
jgi:hypothetical protein